MREFNNMSGYDDTIRPELTYSQNLSSIQLRRNIKIILYYAGLLLAWLIVSKLYLNFGSKWINPAVSAMWVVGGATALLIPEQREHTIKETKWAILAFLCFLFVYRLAIQRLAPISSEQMSAALNIAVPAASGQAASNMLNNLLMIISALTPLGFGIWCGQKFKVFRGRKTKQKAFQELKGYKETTRRF